MLPKQASANTFYPAPKQAFTPTECDLSSLYFSFHWQMIVLSITFVWMFNKMKILRPMNLEGRFDLQNQNINFTFL
jgi:hypothetical protein